MASPIVTGSVALLWHIEPSFINTDIVDIILESSDVDGFWG